MKKNARGRLVGQTACRLESKARLTCDSPGTPRRLVRHRGCEWTCVVPRPRTPGEPSTWQGDPHDHFSNDREVLAVTTIARGRRAGAGYGNDRRLQPW